MSIRNIRRQASNPLAAPGTATSAPIYVDSDDNSLKIIPGGQGSTVEVTLFPSTSPSIQLTATAITVAAGADANKVYYATLGSGTQTFTLPTAASAPGQRNTYVCGSAAGEILINPNAADQISAKGLVDHSTSVKPAAGTGIKNTAASNVLGDHITLVSDGVNTWHEVAGAGIWASQ